MHKILGILLLGGGLAFLAGEYVPSPADREEQVAAMTRIVARATILEPETVPAEQPGLRQPVASPAASGPGLARPAAVALDAPAAQSAPSTLPPIAVETRTPPAATGDGSLDVQRRLAREIQAELKRVGCYTGRLDGSWGDRSRGAMASFMARVNASLPTTEPDVFLLSLIKGQAGNVCGPTCGEDEVLRAGRCTPRETVAEAAPPPAAPAPPAPVVAAARPEPLPGRMAIGGPLPAAAPVAEPVTGDTPAAAAETLPWQAAPKLDPRRQRDMAALDTGDQRRIYAAPAIPRKVLKVRRNAAAPQRPKPIKRRYATSRSVQSLFLHPLGRM